MQIKFCCMEGNIVDLVCVIRNKIYIQIKQRAATTDCTMQFNVMILLLGTSCICLALAQVSYDDCCLKYAKKMSGNAQKHAVKYRRQEPDGGCNIPAVVTSDRGSTEAEGDSLLPPSTPSGKSRH
ncbi:hypothetical protein F2P81_000359 [Scophthalmus maximus]|uniref:Chemokine interleukin-8-like domain-containing protein n=1 Tax=Scophthalmus maximus TaxID=52904 RepID=A0A6A4TGK5_SCOMX|nr:hypothetical protein F2P81_000359 [Scophthalmus maximus]